jgi:hypothetical protein
LYILYNSADQRTGNPIAIRDSARTPITGRPTQLGAHAASRPAGILNYFPIGSRRPRRNPSASRGLRAPDEARFTLRYVGSVIFPTLKRSRVCRSGFPDPSTLLFFIRPHRSREYAGNGGGDSIYQKGRTRRNVRPICDGPETQHMASEHY